MTLKIFCITKYTYEKIAAILALKIASMAAMSYFCATMNTDAPYSRMLSLHSTYLQFRRGIRTIAAILMLSTLGACELIIIKEPTQTRTTPEADQNSPQGVVFIFKSELDSNNVQGAIKVMASDDERPLLAIERLEMQEEIARIGRMIAKRDITALKIDTLSPARQRLRAEFGYLKEITFTTVCIDSLWFISRVIER